MSPILLPETIVGEPVNKGEGSTTVAITGTGTSAPQGLEANLEYNGLILGNTSTIDAYFITSIEGLGDADIRDSRENLPSEHGERAFDSYYGGRTIVINGFIRAHTFTKLRDMQEALRTAFAELEEKSLYWRTPDGNFDHFINCRKIQPIQMTEVQQNFNVFRDFQITLRASDPTFKSVQEHSLILPHNLLSNPSFESDVINSTPANWTLSSSNWTGASMKVISFSEGHGDKGLIFSGTKDNNTTERIIYVNSQVGDTGGGITPGELYKLMSRVLVQEAEAGSKGIRAIINFYSSTNTDLGSVTSDFYTSGVDQDIEVTAQAPENTAYAKALIGVNSDIALDTVSATIGDARIFRVLDSDEEDRTSEYITGCKSTSNATLLGLYMLNSQYLAEDLSGNENHGTPVGGVDLGSATESPEGFDSSTNFDSAGDYIETDLASGFVNGGIKTYLGWAYKENSLANQTMWNGNGTNAPYLAVNTNKDVEFDPSLSSGSLPITWTNAWPGDQEWVFWTLIFDEVNNTAELFINGQNILNGRKTGVTDNFVANPGGFRIDGGNAWSGNMFGLAVYDGAVSRKEMSNLYLMGKNKALNSNINGELFNAGNFKSKPRIRIAGEMSFVHISNDTNSEEFILSSATTIPEGDFYELNVQNRTLVDENGNSVFGDIDFSSDMMKLESGTNNLRLEVDMRGSPSGSVSVFWRDTWI